VPVNRVSFVDALRGLACRLLRVDRASDLIVNPNRHSHCQPRVIRARLKAYDLLARPRHEVSQAFAIFLVIARHSAAHFLQAAAHSLQCSLSCLPHSAAQASQASAQRPQSLMCNGEPRLINATHIAQRSAQSMHSRAHSGIFPKHALAQYSQLCVHSEQAAMQA